MSTPPAQPAGSRLKPLDALRAVAVLLVLGRHLPLEDANPVFDFARHVGWMGVDLFFVLSGFLVSGLLFSEYRQYGELRLGRFFVRRGFKIYPAFYVMLGATMAVRLAMKHELPLRALACEALFVANYGPSLWNHTWSLGVEEHFYLLVGLTLWGLTRRKGVDPFRPLVPLAAALAVGLLGLRIATVLLVQPYDHKTHLFPTHLRIDSLTFGVLLSYLHHFHRERLAAFLAKRRRAVVAVSALLVLPAAFLTIETSAVMETVGLTSLYLGFGGFVLAAVTAPPATNPVMRAGLSLGSVIGFHSYSIYLWHLPCEAWALPRLSRLVPSAAHPLLHSALYVAVSVAVGIVMAKLVENPFLALRDRWFPSRRATSPAEPAKVQLAA